jgi:hypothetical protein
VHRAHRSVTKLYSMAIPHSSESDDGTALSKLVIFLRERHVRAIGSTQPWSLKKEGSSPRMMTFQDRPFSRGPQSADTPNRSQRLARQTKNRRSTDGCHHDCRRPHPFRRNVLDCLRHSTACRLLPSGVCPDDGGPGRNVFQLNCTVRRYGKAVLSSSASYT